jgi:hypothetical protein
MRPLSRIQPVGPVQAYKTYQVSTPRSHTRPASCAEVGCEPYAKGWTTVLHVVDQAQLVHTVRTSGRPFREATDGTQVTFVFEPGTRCFRAAEHRVQVRPEIYVVRDGDWRGNPTGRSRQHDRPEHWVEDFALHQDRIITDLRKG